MALEDNREALKPQTNVGADGAGRAAAELRRGHDRAAHSARSEGNRNPPKHVTLSTSGIIPGIERLARERVRPKLAISLNASNDKQRDTIMPINRKYPIADLIDGLPALSAADLGAHHLRVCPAGRIQRCAEDAAARGELLANLRAKVNLIPWNPGDLPYKPPDAAAHRGISAHLDGKGLPCVRALFAWPGCDGRLRPISAPGSNGAPPLAQLKSRQRLLPHLANRSLHNDISITRGADARSSRTCRFEIWSKRRSSRCRMPRAIRLVACTLLADARIVAGAVDDHRLQLMEPAQ